MVPRDTVNDTIARNEPNFYGARLALARYRECRRVDGKLLSIFQIASGINETIITNDPSSALNPSYIDPVDTLDPNEKFKIGRLDIYDAIAAVPLRRRHQIEDQNEIISEDPESYLTIPPGLLLLLDDGRRLLLDGLARLNYLRQRRSPFMHVFLIRQSTAFHFGRRGLETVDAQVRPLGQRTVLYSLPSSIDDKIGFSGKPRESDVRPAITRELRDQLTETKTANKKEGATDNAESREFSIEAVSTSLIPIVATCVIYENNEIWVALNPPKNSNIKSQLDLSYKIQSLLDFKMKFDSTKFKSGDAGKSIHQFILINYMRHIFNEIKKHHDEINKMYNSHANKRYMLKAAASIVNSDPRYQNAIGKIGDLRERVKDWSELPTPKKGVFSFAIHAGLLQLGLNERFGLADYTNLQREDYGYNLLQAALKAYRIAGNETSNLRHLLSHNLGGREKSRIRSDLDYAVDGEPSGTHLVAWSVDALDRKLLALHGRLNPAKIWRDTAHQTLTYQWLIAIGDLARRREMIVTCHMAAELVYLHPFRVSGDNPKLDEDWDLFDKALALSAAGNPSRENILLELTTQCAEAMQKGRAIRVLLSNREDRCFDDIIILSKETSAAAEAAILLT